LDVDDPLSLSLDFFRRVFLGISGIFCACDPSTKSCESSEESLRFDDGLLDDVFLDCLVFSLVGESVVLLFVCLLDDFGNSGKSLPWV
jgi:hypothetical protein